MRWFKKETLVTGAPLLAADEQLRATAPNTLLRTGSGKTPGTLYLTTKHLIHVDSRKLQLEVPLSSVSSLKVEPVGGELRKVAVQLEQQWTCSICYFSNAASTRVCATCGVAMQSDARVGDSDPVTKSLEPGECPQCTFMNHPSLAFCEMCDAPLTDILPSGSNLEFLLVPNSTEMATALSTVKLRRVEEPRARDALFGIHKLHKSTKKRHGDARDLLTRALGSSAELLAVKSDLIVLSAKLGQTSEAVKFGHEPELLSASRRTLPLASLLTIPVVAGASTPEEIAREIAGLLVGSNVLAQASGMLTFHDVYALYNRARGIGLIAPQELGNALVLCDKLDLPLRCRTLASGLQIVEARGELDRAVTQLLHWITTESQASWRASAGFSARDVSEHFGWSLQIATEELYIAETRGQLCRDENVTGLRFFPNLILRQ